jgi:hypothetical protein
MYCNNSFSTNRTWSTPALLSIWIALALLRLISW